MGLNVMRHNDIEPPPSLISARGGGAEVNNAKVTIDNSINIHIYSNDQTLIQKLSRVIHGYISQNKIIPYK